MTPVELQSLFRTLNVLHFESTLPNIRITIDPKLRNTSYFWPKRVLRGKILPPEIKMCAYSDPVTFRLVLAHEMIHFYLYQRYKGKQDYGHTVSFRKMEERILSNEKILRAKEIIQEVRELQTATV